MDQIFDRLGRLIRSFTINETPKTAASATDQDQREAEEELEEFLNTGKERPRPQQQGQKSYQHQRPGPSLDPDLRKAYAALEISPGATWDEINAAHKRLLMKYHPDRHAGKPEALKDATLVSQRINESYQKIKKHLGR